MRLSLHVLQLLISDYGLNKIDVVYKIDAESRFSKGKFLKEL